MATRVKLTGDKRTVIDGPFAETKELVAGFTILEDLGDDFTPNPEIANVKIK